MNSISVVQQVTLAVILKGFDQLLSDYLLSGTAQQVLYTLTFIFDDTNLNQSNK